MKKMRRSIFILLLVLTCGFAFGQDPEWHFGDFNHNDYQSSMTCNATVYFNDAQFISGTIEIAAFIEQDDVLELRGHCLLDNWVGFFQTWMQIHGNVEDAKKVVTFKAYDHDKGIELLYCATTTIWNADAEFGQAGTPAHILFYTPTTCTFTGSANWSTAANWTPRIPVSCDAAVINGACLVEEGVAPTYSTLTIKDGAQFYDENGTAHNATVEKNIAAYTGEKDNYYFLADPTDSDSFLETGNLLTGNYDLYFFDQAGVDDPDADEPIAKEWQNYKDALYSDPEDFYADYNAYLYANSTNTILSFTGSLTMSDSEEYKKLGFDNSVDYAGFNLIGNPFPCNATVGRGTKTSGFYMLDRVNAEVITVETPIIAPCTALFVVATAKNNNNASVTFTPAINTSANVRSTTNLINIEISDTEGLVDRAYVRFNEQENLQKFTMNEDATHIFFREDGKDYAIVQGNERMNQLPLYFETKEYGQYTVNVKMENMSCEYLHLIDNITGADIDLNATPSYTFRAKQGDYSARFRLVFEGTGVEEEGNTENFVIVEGNRFIIPEVQNGSTLTVIDMMGRVVSSQTISGSFDQVLNLANGMYIVRLNGKTQKIVVK